MKKISRKVITTLLIVTSVLFMSCPGQVGGGNTDETKDYFDYSNQNYSVNNVQGSEDHGCKCYNWDYKTIDQSGAVIDCSSFLEYVIPTTSTTKAIDLIVVDCHGTILSNDDAPTNIGASFGANITSKNILVIAPDYIGYGTSVAKEHPYMMADLCARTILDAVLSAIKNASSFGFSLNPGYQTILCGYSQGGQTSLATLRAIQDKIPSELASLINVKKCYSGAGPHDLEATMNIFLEDWKDEAISPLIYLVIKGMLSADYDFLSAYSISDFMTTEFLKSDLCKRIDAKDITIGDVLSNNELLMQYLNFRDVTKVLTSAALNPESSLHKALKKALKLNNLSSGWTVKKDLYIFHHQNDDMVPYINFQKDSEGIGKASCVDMFTDTKNYKLNPYDFLHGKAADTFYKYVTGEIINN